MPLPDQASVIKIHPDIVGYPRYLCVLDALRMGWVVHDLDGAHLYADVDHTGREQIVLVDRLDRLDAAVLDDADMVRRYTAPGVLSRRS